MDPVIAARQLVARYPDAHGALLAGSVLTRHRTALSDLDIYLLVDGIEPWRATFEWEGWPVELFVNTVESVKGFARKEAVGRRSPTLRMWSTGTLLLDRTGRAAELQAWARRVFEAGPAPLDAATCNRLRYVLTDCLDDLAAAPEAEVPFVALAAVMSVSDLFLASHHHWTGSGKWLRRELEDAEPGFADRLQAAHRSALLGNRSALQVLATQVLDLVGGPLLLGFSQGDVVWSGGLPRRSA